MRSDVLGASDLHSWNPLKPSSSPSATILSEKMILILPSQLFLIYKSAFCLPLKQKFLLMKKIFFYLWRELCWRALFYPSVQLKIKLGFPAAPLFRTWSERNERPKSTPRPLILFGSSPPCTVHPPNRKSRTLRYKNRPIDAPATRFEQRGASRAPLAWCPV